MARIISTVLTVRTPSPLILVNVKMMIITLFSEEWEVEGEWGIIEIRGKGMEGKGKKGRED